MEIGIKTQRDTKEVPDGHLKLPVVMKDMLKFIINKHTTIRRDIGIVGYSILGKIIQCIHNEAYSKTVYY